MGAGREASADDLSAGAVVLGDRKRDTELPTSGQQHIYGDSRLLHPLLRDRMTQNGITEVGKYRVVEQIGEGAMGVVYRAQDPVLNRTVAIKVMSESLARDDDLRGRFLREAQAAGSLQHPNVITIYDFGEVDGHLFIAMEYVAGDDLEGMLRRYAPLSVVQKIDILIDVLGGLGYAHKRGVVHRDIKPANIRIDEEGRARIMDFGIAHLQSSKLTRTGLMVGTPAYMAPEQVTGGPISPATDIFSVGAVMYELFTGRKPFEGESLQSVFYKIVSQAPADLTNFAPSLPRELNSIVMRALAKDPNDRFASAAEMAGALAEARALLDRISSQPKGLSLQSAINSGLSTRTTRRIPSLRRRGPMIATGGVAILVVATTGILFALRSPGGSGATAQRPETIPTPPAASASAVPSASSVPTTNASVNPAPPVVTPPAGVQPAGTAAPSKASDKPAAKQTAKPDAPSAQELSLFRSLQTSAMESRRRASEAGATPDQLRAGDDHSTAAINAVQQGKLTDAANHLGLATSAWGAAERDARNAASAAAAAASAAKTRVDAPVQPKQEAVVPPPVVAPPPAPATTRTPPSNPAVEIDAVVAAYTKAIESRDINEVRRAYVGVTSAQASAWAQFFRSVRSMRVTLAVSNLDVHGDAADARLTGAYEFVTTNGKNEQQPANFQAGFRRDGGVWKLVSVR